MSRVKYSPVPCHLSTAKCKVVLFTILALPTIIVLRCYSVALKRMRGVPFLFSMQKSSNISYLAQLRCLELMVFERKRYGRGERESL